MKDVIYLLCHPLRTLAMLAQLSGEYIRSFLPPGMAPFCTSPNKRLLPQIPRRLYKGASLNYLNAAVVHIQLSVDHSAWLKYFDSGARELAVGAVWEMVALIGIHTPILSILAS